MGMNKYDRMLHILNLLRSRRNLNAQRIADECGVTERSIYRDMISLSEMNIPVYYDNGYKLASDNFLPALNFTLDEYNLLKLALGSSPLVRTPKYHDAFKSVHAKIETCLSDQVRREKKLKPPTTHIDIPVSDGRKEGEKFYSQIETAITASHRIIVHYQSLQTGPTVRKVDPYFIIFRGRAFYFVGYCHLRREFRTFRINRVTAVETTDESFVKQDDLDPRTYFEGSWEVFSGEPVEVTIVFKGIAARLVSGVRHHPSERIEPLGTDSIRYTVTVRGLEEIQRWILGFGDQAEVIAPEKLRENLARIGCFFADRYGKRPPNKS